MANNGLPDFQFATPVTDYQQGMQTGNALQAQQIQLQNAQQNQQDQNALRVNASDALYGTGDTQTNALKTIAGVNPDAAIKIGAANSQGVQDQLAAANAKAQKVTQDLVALTSIPAGPAREQAYQSTLDREQAAGQDVSAMRNLPADQGIKMAYMKAASIQDAFKNSGLGPAEGTVVAPGGVLADKNTGKVLFNNPAQGDFQGAIPLGNGTTGAGLVNRTNGTFTPLSMGGGAGQPATASGPATPPPSFAAAMNQMIAGGQTADQAMQTLEHQYPNSQIAMSTDPTTGKFVDAAPAQSTVSSDASGGGFGGGPANAGLGFGVSPAKVTGDNVIQKRQAEISSLKSAGTSFTPAQEQAYLTTGKMTGDADAPLSAGDESEAQAMAAYKLPISAYSLSKPTLQPIIQRAMQINPNFSAQQYDQNKTVLNDLSSSSVGKSGGTLTAAQTALDHLSDMADISSRLPSSVGAVNAVENAFGNATNTGSAPALKAWNQAKTLLAGEASKMIKGGVASQGEVDDMLSNLNPNDPNRNVALAKVAAFMNDKVTEMQDKRDSVLGPSSPGTSLLSRNAQANALKVIGLDPHNQLPQFARPGGMGAATSSAGLPSAPITATNSMGHKIALINGQWVPQ